MDKLKAVLSDWKGWASVIAILLLIASAVSTRLRKIISKVLVDYLAAHWRHFWYWLTNKTFTVSGRSKFRFAANLTADQKAIADFNLALRRESSIQVVEGEFLRGTIKMQLTEIRNVALQLNADTGQVLGDMFQGANGNVDDGNGTPPAGTEMTIKWENVAVNYREFRDTVDCIRRVVDQIRNDFAMLVSNTLNETQNVYLVVFFEKNMQVDNSVEQDVSALGANVNIKRVKGATSFGAVNLDAIIPYLPRYLVRETIADLMKKHILTT